MRKSPSLAILMLAVACLLVFACKTTGTPARSAGAPAKSAGASSQAGQVQASGLAKAAKPAKSASKKKAAKLAKQSRKAKPVTAARLKNLAIKTVHNVQKLANPSRTRGSQSLRTMRAIIYAALAAIFLVAVGATVAARVRRHRRLTPSPAGARP